MLAEKDGAIQKIDVKKLNECCPGQTEIINMEEACIQEWIKQADKKKKKEEYF